MLLRELQRHSSEQLMSNRLVRAVVAQRASREEYVAYMKDVYCYARHSSRVIAQAGARLVSTHPALADYLFRHASEELGHDAWAAADLCDLGLAPGELAAVEPSAPCLRMIALEHYCASQANPVGLFGWMFVLESLGGQVGGGVAAALDSGLRLQGRATKFLRGHAEADAKHSADLYEVIESGVRAADDVAAFRRMARESLELYVAILDGAAHPARAA